MTRQSSNYLFGATILFLWSAVIFSLNITCAGPTHTKGFSINEGIEKSVEQLKKFKALEYKGQSISAVNVIPAFYERRNYSAAWDSKNINDLLYVINEIYKDGLNPSDYHLDLISELKGLLSENRQKDTQRHALFDIFLTDSLLRLSYHIVVGKVDPERLDPNWNLAYDLNYTVPEVTIQQVLDSHNIIGFIDDLKPDHFYYLRMKKALAHYRDLKHKGGWNVVSVGPTLKLGMTDNRVVELRKRLLVTADLEAYIPEDERTFDTKLEQGVKEFQRRHGLIVDGLVGKNISKALNVSVDQRIDQIRVNLERARWVLRNLPPEFIIINIAGFTVFLVKNGESVWRSKVVVGKTYRKTPVFKAEMMYIDFNPTWTVPPIILRNDILPEVKKDPVYLQKKRIRVLSKTGQEIPQDTINWSRYSALNFPYILRQDPGPDNGLGVVKFMFPNKHFVFLHDTPSKSLFEKDIRTFSSGCIRVQNPLELAELLLSDQEYWNREAIEKVVAWGKTKTVHLKKPIPVLVLYWTSRVDQEGKVQFLPDVYNRDQEVLRELDAEFKVRKRDVQ